MTTFPSLATFYCAKYERMLFFFYLYTSGNTNTCPRRGSQYIQARTPVCTRAHTHMHTHSITRIHTQKHTHTRTHAHTHTHTHTHTHRGTLSHTHTHTQRVKILCFIEEIYCIIWLKKL